MASPNQNGVMSDAMPNVAVHALTSAGDSPA